MSAKTLRIQTTVNAPVEKVWKHWNDPKHVQQWNNASDDWHSPHAENDLREGGNFKYTMAAKDGSYAFDFEGTYSVVDPHRQIAYTLGDGRKVNIEFTANGNETNIVEDFEAEDTNPLEMQQDGWQAILDNFRKHVESH